MTTSVTGKNQITIPAQLAARFALKPGSKIEWFPGPGPEEFRCVVLPDSGTVAQKLLGAGKKYLARAAIHPLAALEAERETE